MKVETLTLRHPHWVISLCNFSCRLGSQHHSSPWCWFGHRHHPRVLSAPFPVLSLQSLGISAVRILCHSPLSLSIYSHPYCTEQLALIGVPWTAGFSKWQSNWGCSAKYLQPLGLNGLKLMLLPVPVQDQVQTRDENSGKVMKTQSGWEYSS